MGRPKVAQDVGRSAMIFARVTPQEKALLARRAKELHRSGSSLVRSALLAYLRHPPAAVEG